MPQKRGIGVCLNCHEEKELFSHGLCQTCNMRNRRSEETTVDPHVPHPRLRKERQKLRIAYAKLINCAENLSFTDGEIEKLKVMAKPHLAKIIKTLASELGEVESESLEPEITEE